MADEEWISFQEAVEIAKARLNASMGRSQAVVREARASGEVRIEPLLLLADDGIVGMDIWPGDLVGMDLRLGRPAAWKAREPGLSKGDLLDWLDRHAPPTKKPQQKRRYPGDAKLAERGRKMVAKGMSARQAAAKLACEAIGGSIEQRIERLRKMM